jgi:hypothetical protein
MLTRWAVLLIGLAVAAPATAEEMSPERARRFTVGKLFAFSCFDGTRGIGSIYGDGSVAGTIQFFGSGPERSASLPAGTLKVKGDAVCASIKGMPFEPASNSTGPATIASAARCWASASLIAILAAA